MDSSNSPDQPKPSGWGGARPGAGRKKQDTEDAQQARRDVVLEVVTPVEWKRAIEGMLRAIAGEGNAKAFQALAPYVMGSPVQKVELEENGQLRVEVVYVDAGPPGPAAPAPGAAADQGRP